MNKFNKLLLSTLGAVCVFGATAFAASDVNFRSIDSTINVLQRADSLISEVRKYNLAEHIKIFSKNQRNSNNCWTMPILTVFETNRALKYGITEELSALHMDYATSQSFGSGVNEYGYDREVNTAGTAEWAMSYFMSGIGPIYEICMPFNDKFEGVNVSDVKGRIIASKVTDWLRFEPIYKEITDGNVKYFKADIQGNKTNNEYNADELNDVRNKIKEHIMKNGAVSAEMYISDMDTFFNAEHAAYFCDDPSVKVDHGVAIIGWDDDFPKEYFNEGHRPTSNGAYLVQNSWGKDDKVGDKFYVSYEDLNIEVKRYGIINTAEKDNAETVYQYDYLARNFSIELDAEDVYGANVFRRNKNEEEVLNEIGFSTFAKMNYEVYVNANNGNLNSDELVLVKKSTEPVENGYHVVKLDSPINLTGDAFAIAIKYIGTDGNVITMQVKNNTYYSNVDGGLGQSFIGTSLDEMIDIKNEAELSNSMGIAELPSGNICIKAFTKKANSTFEIIKGDANLDGVVDATDLALLKMHLVKLITLTGYSFKAVDYNEDGELTTVDLSLEIRSMDRVNGDINGDGVTDATDLILLKMHLTKLKILTGRAFNSVDYNRDGKLSTADLSIQMRNIVK